MKNSITCLIIAGLAVISMLCTTCKKKEDTPPVDEFTFILISGPGFTSGDVTLSTGEQFKVGIDAKSTGPSGITLSRFHVTTVLNDKPDVIFDSTLQTNSFRFDYHGIARGEPAIEKWIFTVFTSAGDSIEHSFMVTSEPIVGPIYTYDNRILGGQENLLGGWFATTNGEVYTIDVAKANAGIIDWCYFFDFTALSVIAAPNDDLAGNIFNEPVNGLQTWSVKNPTLFKLITSPVVWDSITNDTELINLTQSGVTGTRIAEVKTGDFIAFITVNGKKGLLRVNTIIGEEDGTMDISVKVQQ